MIINLFADVSDKDFEISIPSDVEKEEVMRITETFSDYFINSEIESITNLLSDKEICFNNSMFLTPSNFIGLFKPMRGSKIYTLKDINVYNFNDCITNSDILDIVTSVRDYFSNAKLFSNIHLLNAKNEIVQINLLLGKTSNHLWKIESVNFSALNIYSPDENIKYPGGSKKWKMRKLFKGNLKMPLLKEFSSKNSKENKITFTNKSKTAQYEISVIENPDSLFEKGQTIFYNQIKDFKYKDIIVKFIPNGYLFATTYNNEDEEICYHCAVIQNEENCFKIDFISSVEYYNSKWYSIDFSLKSISLR